ncbi:hypothetical protein B7463_g5476, partial [Scytalidium lignicola]
MATKQQPNDDLVKKLQKLDSSIEEICQISGNVGLSVGVLHQGEAIRTSHYGYRDFEANLPPDDDTVYYFSSLTKAMTSAAFGILVDESKITWDTLICDILPEFNHQNPILRKEATITDLLSHRTGLAGKTCLWIQGQQHMLLPKKEIIRTWKYSNWGYALAGEIIEVLSGMKFGEFLQSRIFDPLGMTRTTASVPGPDNVAVPYMVYDNGSPCKVAVSEVAGETVMVAALGVTTTTKDLLTFYQALLATNTAELASNDTRKTDFVLKNVGRTFTPHIACGKAPIEERSYGLGWVRTQLPGSLGIIGLNNMYLGGMPVIGKSSKKVVLSHSGSLSGYLAAVIMVPDTQTAIIVMGNSLPFADPPDLICQMILEAILDEPDPVDFVQLTQASRDGHIASYYKIAEELQAGLGVPSKRSPDNYVGRYWNSVGNFVIDVSLHGSNLRVTMQDRDDVGYYIESYEGETFWWGPPNRQIEECDMAMFPRTYAGWHKFKFLTDDDGNVNSLMWAHDPGVSGGETFFKRPA